MEVFLCLIIRWTASVGRNDWPTANPAGKSTHGHFESVGGRFLDVFVTLALVQGFHDVSGPCFSKEAEVSRNFVNARVRGSFLERVLMCFKGSLLPFIRWRMRLEYFIKITGFIINATKLG